MTIYEESGLEGKTVQPGQEETLCYMKLGMIGNKTLESVGNVPNEVLPLFKGYFISGKSEELRAELHKFIDQACDAHDESRKQNG